MKPVDLILFAEHSQKLPVNYLSVLIKEKKDRTWKLLLGHSLDLLTITLITSVLIFIFNESIRSVIIVREIQKILTNENIWFYFSLLFPPTIFLYFFVSYFLNHGQSYGMFLMKKRIVMESKSFVEALIWSSHSTLLCLSFGFSYFLKNSHWISFKEHDYLYNNLVAHLEISPISLIEEVAAFNKQPLQEQNLWDRAS